MAQDFASITVPPGLGAVWPAEGGGGVPVGELLFAPCAQMARSAQSGSGEE